MDSFENSRYSVLLGCALREGDAENFFQIYDSLLPKELPEEQVELIKDEARRISALGDEEFNSLVAGVRQFSLAPCATFASSSSTLTSAQQHNMSASHSPAIRDHIVNIGDDDTDLFPESNRPSMDSLNRTSRHFVPQKEADYARADSDSGVCCNASSKATASLSDSDHCDEDEDESRGVYDYFVNKKKFEAATNSELARKHDQAYDVVVEVGDEDDDDDFNNRSSNHKAASMYTYSNKDGTMCQATEMTTFKYPNEQAYDEVYEIDNDTDSEDIDKNVLIHERLYGGSDRSLSYTAMKAEDEKDYTHDFYEGRTSVANHNTRLNFTSTGMSASRRHCPREVDETVKFPLSSSSLSKSQPPFPDINKIYPYTSKELLGSAGRQSVPNLPAAEAISQSPSANTATNTRKKRRKKKSVKDDSGGDGSGAEQSFDVNGNPTESSKTALRLSCPTLKSNRYGGHYQSLAQIGSSLEGQEINGRSVSGLSDTSHSNSDRHLAKSKNLRKLRRAQNTVTASDIPGHRGNKEIDELLSFINSNGAGKQKKKDNAHLLNSRHDVAPSEGKIPANKKIKDRRHKAATSTSAAKKAEDKESSENSSERGDDQKSSSNSSERGEDQKSSENSSERGEDQKSSENSSERGDDQKSSENSSERGDDQNGLKVYENADEKPKGPTSVPHDCKDVNNDMILEHFDTRKNDLTIDNVPDISQEEILKILDLDLPSKPKVEEEFTVVGKKKKRDRCSSGGNYSNHKDMVLPSNHSFRNHHFHTFSSNHHVTVTKEEPTPRPAYRPRPPPRSVTPPPVPTISANIAHSPTERAFSPSAFPELAGMQRDGRRNSTGNVPSALPAQDDSDLESVKSFPPDSTKTSPVGGRPVLSYAKIAAGPKPPHSPPSAPGNSQDITGAVSTERRHSFGALSEGANAGVSHCPDVSVSERTYASRSQELPNMYDDVAASLDFMQDTAFNVSDSDAALNCKSVVSHPESEISISDHSAILSTEGADDTSVKKNEPFISHPPETSHIETNKDIERTHDQTASHSEGLSASECGSSPLEGASASHQEWSHMPIGGAVDIPVTKQPLAPRETEQTCPTDPNKTAAPLLRKNKTKSSVIFLDKRVRDLPKNLGIKFGFDNEEELNNFKNGKCGCDVIFPHVNGLVVPERTINASDLPPPPQQPTFIADLNEVIQPSAPPITSHPHRSKQVDTKANFNIKDTIIFLKRDWDEIMSLKNSNPDKVVIYSG